MLLNPKSIEIIAGMNDLDGDLYDANKPSCGGQIGYGKKIIVHKDYNPKNNYANDIALIYLESPFWINNVSWSKKPLVIFRWWIIYASHHRVGDHQTTKSAWSLAGDFTLG